MNNTVANLLWGTLLAASWGGACYWGFYLGAKSGYRQGQEDAEAYAYAEGVHPTDPLPDGKKLGAIYTKKPDLFTPNYKAACKDGAYSSAYGSGTCTKHGGVKRYI
ncbi:MAG: hypothetical protein RIS64_4573 [Bacteroidota bacterium]|jgi:hypothetical protein